MQHQEPRSVRLPAISLWTALSLAAAGCGGAASEPAPRSDSERAAGAIGTAAFLADDDDGEVDSDSPSDDDSEWTSTSDWPAAEDDEQTSSPADGDSDWYPWPSTDDDANTADSPGSDAEWPAADDSVELSTDSVIRTVGNVDATSNNWGCDIDVPGFASFSEGEWGACCDEHDACFERNNCNWTSFFDEDKISRCSLCNQAVADCMDTKPGPGPSVCTYSESTTPCGSYRSGDP